MAKATHTCNGVYQVENKVKFLAAEALRGVNSTHLRRTEAAGLQTSVGQAGLSDRYSSRTRLRFGQGSRCATTGADGPDSAQSSEAQQSQFVDENHRHHCHRRRGRTPVSQTLSEDHRDSTVRGFRRSWRFFSCSTLSKWSMSMLRIQKTAQMPQVQFIDKLVDDPVLRRTSSSSPSPTANGRDASDSVSGNSTEW